jgi:O-antigen/teichoic acid export membrane protein
VFLLSKLKKYIYKLLGINSKSLNRIYTELFWIILGQIISVLGSIALVRVLTEYLTPSNYGELSLAFTISNTANQIIMAIPSIGIGRFYSIANEKDDLKGVIAATKRIFLLASLTLLGFVIILIGCLILTHNLKWITLVLTIFPFIVVSSLNSTFSSLQNAARQRAIVTLHSGLDVWLRIAFAVFAMILLGKNPTSVIIGYLIAAITISSSQYYFLKKVCDTTIFFISNIKFNEWLKAIWSFSWPFAAWGVFTSIHQISDRWALEYFTSTDIVGKYSVVYQFGYAPISLLTGLLMTLLSPIIYNKSVGELSSAENELMHKNFLRILKLSLSITTLVFLITYLLHNWLFSWVVSKMYQDISYLLPWIVLAGGLFASSQMISLKLMTELRTGELLKVKVGTALFGIVMNYLGAWLFGVIGIVCAQIFFSVSYLIWMIILIKKKK